MTARLPCPPAPAPPEAYAAHVGDLFASRAQRRGFRDYVGGLLRERDRNKTLTCLAGTEPTAGAQHREAQRLQWFPSESNGDEGKGDHRRLEVLADAPAARPHPGGMLVVDQHGSDYFCRTEPRCNQRLILAEYRDYQRQVWAAGRRRPRIV